MKCVGCILENKKIKPKGEVLLTKYFRCAQDYEIPISGFMILSTRRHIKSIADFTKKEREEFIELLYKIRKAMKTVLKIKIVHLIQHEDSKHHFHLWLLPRYKWMKRFGKYTESIVPILDYAKKNLKNKKNLEKIDLCVKKLKRKLK